jgi:hypothetical protein
MKTTAAILIALFVAVAVAPAAQADDFPANEDPHCTYEVKDRFKLEPVLRKGLPVEITCDGPGRVAAMLELRSRKQRNDWLDMHSGGVPGVSTSRPHTFEAAGSTTIRVKIIPKKFFRRYAKTKVQVLVGVERKPPYITSLDPGKTVTLVR